MAAMLPFGGPLGFAGFFFFRVFFNSFFLFAPRIAASRFPGCAAGGAFLRGAGLGRFGGALGFFRMPEELLSVFAASEMDDELAVEMLESVANASISTSENPEAPIL